MKNDPNRVGLLSNEDLEICFITVTQIWPVPQMYAIVCNYLTHMNILQ